MSDAVNVMVYVAVSTDHEARHSAESVKTAYWAVDNAGCYELQRQREGRTITAVRLSENLKKFSELTMQLRQLSNEQTNR